MILTRLVTDISIRDKNHETGLHLAARNGRVDCMRTLLSHGAECNARNSDGWTPLHWCCANGRTEGTK